MAILKPLGPSWLGAKRIPGKTAIVVGDASHWKSKHSDESDRLPDAVASVAKPRTTPEKSRAEG